MTSYISEKIIAVVSLEEWNEYHNDKDEWHPVRNDEPIRGLKPRNNLSHSQCRYVASGVDNPCILGSHCGGIDLVCFSEKDKIYKVDRYRVRRVSESNECEISLLSKKEIPDLHHIKNEELLYVKYPILDKSEQCNKKTHSI